MKLRYRLTSWEEMPEAVRRTWLRMQEIFPGDGFIDGWEFTGQIRYPGVMWAMNRSGHFYQGRSDWEIHPKSQVLLDS